MPAARNAGPDRNLGGRPPRSSRQAVVDAGLEILRSQGLAAVTLSAVGQRLGLGKVALYTYVASKDDLLRAMRDEVNRRQLDALKEEVGLSPDLALKACCTRLVEIMAHYGELMTTVEPDVTGPGLEVGEQFLDLLARMGLAPEQQFQVYLLLAGFLTSPIARRQPEALNGTAHAAPAVEQAVSREAERFPRLQLLLAGAVHQGGDAQAAVLDDVLSLIIDVLIPTLRSRAPAPGTD